MENLEKERERSFNKKLTLESTLKQMEKDIKSNNR